MATPMPLEVMALTSPETDLLMRKGIKLAGTRDLEKRLSADFSMDKTWENEVLFGFRDIIMVDWIWYPVWPYCGDKQMFKCLL